MANKEQVVQDFIAILGQEKVISDRDAIIAAGRHPRAQL